MTSNFKNKLVFKFVLEYFNLQSGEIFIMMRHFYRNSSFYEKQLIRLTTFEDYSQKDFEKIN